MINKIKPKTEFTRNILTLMTGTSIAQAIPIIISPILTRIYTPKDFGIFALFMAISSILGVISNGKYELAIMLPKKDEDAINICALGFIISSLLSFFIFIIIFIFHNYIIQIISNKNIDIWLYFIPIIVFLMGLFNILNYWNNRKKNYKDLAKINVLKAIILAIVQLSIGFLYQGAIGLISGSIISQLFSNIKLTFDFYKNNNFFHKISKIKMIALAKKYKDFPLINMPHTFLNIFSSNIVIIIIGIFFQNSLVGFFALANKTLNIPSAIIASAYNQVFFHQLNKNKTNNLKNLLFFKKTIFKILLFSLPITILVFIYSEDAFSFIFGEKWRIAGLYAKILIPALYLRFTGSIVSIVTIVYNQQKKAFFIEIFNTIFRILSISIGILIDNLIIGLILFSIVSIIITLYRLLWYISIIEKYEKEKYEI